MCSTAVLLAEGLYPAHLQARFGQNAKELGQFFVGSGKDCVGVGNIGSSAFIGVGVIKAVIVANEGEEVLQRSFKADTRFDLLHLGLNARNFADTSVENLIGC